MPIRELTQLTVTEFDRDRLRRPGLWVVELGAPGCPACRAMEPILRQLAADLGGSVGFGAVNVDEEAVIADQFNVMHLPTLLVFRDGEPFARHVGATGREELLWLLQLAASEPAAVAA